MRDTLRLSPVAYCQAEALTLIRAAAQILTMQT